MSEANGQQKTRTKTFSWQQVLKALQRAQRLPPPDRCTIDRIEMDNQQLTVTFTATRPEQR